MFSRYLYSRRGCSNSENSNGAISSPANAAVIPLSSVASSSPRPPTSSTKQRRRRQNERSNGERSSHEDASLQAAVAASTLEELRLALDRLEYLIAKVAPPSLVAPLFPLHTTFNEENKEKNKDGIVSQEEDVAIVSAYNGICTDDLPDGSSNASCDTKMIRYDNSYAAAAPGADEIDNAGEEAAVATATYSVQKKFDASTFTTATNTNNVNNNISNNYAKSDKCNKIGIFLQVEQTDEFEIIELLRRIAELVVLSERKAAKLMYNAASFAAVSDANKNVDDCDDVDDEARGNDDRVVGKDVGRSERVIMNSFDGGLATVGAEKRKTAGEGSRKTKVIHRHQRLDYNEDDASPFLAPFELFCERNSLAKIVEIVTGAAFSSQEPPPPPRPLQSGQQYVCDLEEPTNDIDDNEGRQRNHLLLFLPPISIATQALQSVSILIQNVSRATSLYFLLSNNVVNDLIRLPLDSYRLATREDLYSLMNDEEQQLARNSNKPTTKAIHPNHRQQSSQPEISELITHFVSFLKSLAMRMNAETVQFFLSFPDLNDKININPTPFSLTEEESELGYAFYNYEKLSTISRFQLTAKSGYERMVEFPLYARALEFCAYSDRCGQLQDPFIRVTAMNICMNILRLVTIHNNDDIGNTINCECRAADDFDGHEITEKGIDDEDGLNDCARAQRAYDVQDGQRPRKGHKRDERPKRHRHKPISIPTSTPTGFLHDDPPVLPIQDCITIAQFACRPARVSELISPLCMRLTSRLGQVEEFVRMLLEVDGEEENNENNDGNVYDTKLTATVTASLPAKKSLTLSWSPPPSKSIVTATKPSFQEAKKGGVGEETKQQSERDQQHATAAAETTRRRLRLHHSLHDLMADVQDELLLLDDLLKVGLISLNEQTIEMVLATFVYPMLLQPLLLLLLPQQMQDCSKTAVAAAGRRRKKTMTPQSSSHFSSPYEAAEISDSVGESTSIDITPSGIIGSNNTIDLAAAKTALYGLSLVFNTITNTTFRYLLLTALFHPLSASVVLSGEKCSDMVDSSGSQITLPKSSTKRCTRSSWYSGESTYLTDDSQSEVRTEANQVRKPSTKLNYPFQQDVANVYSFGTKTHRKHREDIDQVERNFGKKNKSSSNIVFDKNDNVGNARHQVFILAPGLLYLLQNASKTTYAGFKWEIGGLISNETDDTPSSYTITTRANPFRKVLFSLISGPSELVALQPLATAALQAAVMSADSSIIRMIMFSSMGDGRRDIDSSLISTSAALAPGENNCTNFGDEFVTETMKYLCKGVVNTHVMKDGWWTVKFNTVAAQTLMAVISNDHNYIRLASKIFANIRDEAAKILIRFPSRMDAKSWEEMENNIINEVDNINDTSNVMRLRTPMDKEHLDHWLLDRFFFDHADNSTSSVVENLCYLKEHTGSNDQFKERYRYGLEVLTTISMAATCALLCGNSPIVDNMAPDESLTLPFHYSTTWALACLYLDAFCVKLTKMCDDKKGMSSLLLPEPNVVVSQQKLSYISQTGTRSRVDNSQDLGSFSSLAHISSKFAIALLDDGDSLERRVDYNSNNTLPPVYGSVVELAGKAAFPCVCEVSRAFSNLFTGRTCISNEGIQWQSLYLVVVGRWAVLAEPGHSGTGVEGRVITSCRLACLAVKKDLAVSVNSRTPARRLLVAHASLDPHPPSLFLADSSPSSTMQHDRGGPNLGQNRLRIMRSRMDLWFEDETSASHACKIISNKIAKARTRRGARIKTALLTRYFYEKNDLVGKD
ncbi:hypothetical protein ACHAXA_005243 [Cyclostephanos tholiformis]|uniref:FPL domain-containing protein n=1 Tax=Cyclostephanos tholiformis TaxID=382380 RepID=A0ABD3RXB5_9STRA